MLILPLKIAADTKSTAVFQSRTAFMQRARFLVSYSYCCAATPPHQVYSNIHCGLLSDAVVLCTLLYCVLLVTTLNLRRAATANTNSKELLLWAPCE